MSVHTPWLLLPGVSPWVHHFAVHWWPLKDTTEPPVYAVDGFHAGAEQLPPPPVFDGVGDGEPVFDGVGDGPPVVFDGVGDGAGQPAALPLTSLTTSFSSVVPGSRSSSENIIAPPSP